MARTRAAFARGTPYAVTDSRKGHVTAERVIDTSPRVVIRRFRVADVDDFLRYQGSPAVRRYQRGAAMTAPAAAAFVELQARQSYAERGAWHAFAIELVSEQRVIGDVGVWIPIQARPAVGDVGFQLDPRYHGRGFAREALQAFLPSVFETFALDRVTASCDERNAASWGLLERLGFELIGRSDTERHYEAPREQWSSGPAASAATDIASRSHAREPSAIGGGVGPAAPH